MPSFVVFFVWTGFGEDSAGKAEERSTEPHTTRAPTTTIRNVEPIGRTYLQLNPCLVSGSERTRTPVAVNSALVTAGRIGGSAGSPSPVGLLSDVRKWT